MNMYKYIYIYIYMYIYIYIYIGTTAPGPSFPGPPATLDVMNSRLPVPIVPEYGLSGQRNPYYHKSMPEVYIYICIYIYIYIYI
jgi:hypothetical protein